MLIDLMNPEIIEQLIIAASDIRLALSNHSICGTDPTKTLHTCAAIIDDLEVSHDLDPDIAVMARHGNVEGLALLLPSNDI